MNIEGELFHIIQAFLIEKLLGFLATGTGTCQGQHQLTFGNRTKLMLFIKMDHRARNFAQIFFGL
jgi:hypothetical protein